MPCTCAGTAPGYPQHESWCGQPEPDVEVVEQEDWFEAVMAAGPTEQGALNLRVIAYINPCRQSAGQLRSMYQTKWPTGPDSKESAVTVAELIEALSKYPSDKAVWIGLPSEGIALEVDYVDDPMGEGAADFPVTIVASE